MADNKEENRKLTNRISEHTGQFDARFLLWRQFCAENDVPVDSLPGDLAGDVRQKWDQLKAGELDKK